VEAEKVVFSALEYSSGGQTSPALIFKINQTVLASLLRDDTPTCIRTAATYAEINCRVPAMMLDWITFFTAQCVYNLPA